jgi:hypothetical protein
VAWIGGTRVTGEALAFLTWSNAGSSIDGHWVARNLGQGPTRIVAARRAGWQRLEAGQLDVLATDVTFPWPAEIFIPVAQ